MGESQHSDRGASRNRVRSSGQRQRDRLVVRRAAGDGFSELHVTQSRREVGSFDLLLTSDRANEFGLHAPDTQRFGGGRHVAKLLVGTASHVDLFMLAEDDLDCAAGSVQMNLFAGAGDGDAAEVVDAARAARILGQRLQAVGNRHAQVAVAVRIRSRGLKRLSLRDDSRRLRDPARHRFVQDTERQQVDAADRGVLPPVQKLGDAATKV